jgi:hypothetical protein
MKNTNHILPLENLLEVAKLLKGYDESIERQKQFLNECKEELTKENNEELLNHYLKNAIKRTTNRLEKLKNTRVKIINDYFLV